MTALLGLVDLPTHTLATNAARALFNGQDPGNAVWQSLLWAAGITIVFATLSIRRFSTAASRG